MKVFRATILFVFLFSAFAKVDLYASTTVTTQCAMCRAVLQSEEDNSTAKGVNNGIKYLMIIPYILVGGVFYFIYKSRKASKESENGLEEE